METFKKILLSILLIAGLLSCKPHKSTLQPQKNPGVAEKSQSVYVNGENLRYIEKGSGEPLIFIHGTVGDYRIWIPRVEKYSTGYNVVAYSRRYAYPNKKIFDKSVDYSVRIHASDLYAVIQEFGFEKVNLVGHSYGAYTALAMALDHPEVVESLVLGEPPAVSLLENSIEGKRSFDEFDKKYLQSAGEAFGDNKNEKGVETFLKGVSGEGFSLNQVPQEVKQSWMDNLPEVWGVSNSEWILPLDISKIKALEVPVLLLTGDQSPLWFREIIRELHRSLPKSELVEIENSSHGLYFENPQACDRAIMEFLEKH